MPGLQGVTPMKIAAAYVRVSTDDQLEYSPDSQLQAIRDYAKSLLNKRNPRISAGVFP